MIRFKEVALSAYEIGVEKTAVKYNIKPSSVERYVRMSKQNRNTPKVLLLDIETSLMIVYVWDLHKQKISYKQIKEERYILCWAAKWLYAPDIMSDCVTVEETKERNDKRIMESIWKLLDEADVIIGHNIKQFDNKRIKWEFARHNMYPPSDVEIIDTLEQSRKNFAPPSHALGYLAGESALKLYNLKLNTNYELWIHCDRGSQEKLDQMVTYCQHDVLVEEDLYVRYRPYIKPHPNFGLYSDGEDGKVCPTCGSTLLILDKEYCTHVNKYDSYKCVECGSNSRAWKSNVTDKDHLLRSLAR